MEQSRIAASQTAQSAQAPARTKGTAKPSADSAQAPAEQGGFMALMAALDQGVLADAAVDEKPGTDWLVDASVPTAGQAPDPMALMNMQGLLAAAGTGAGGRSMGGSTAGTFQLDMNMHGLAAEVSGAGGLSVLGSTAGTFQSDGAPYGAGLAWNVDASEGGLVAQTAALDGLGDIKDGDNAAAALVQGRPGLLRATAALAQRTEALSSLASGLSAKAQPAEFTRPFGAAADSAVAAAASMPLASLRDAGALLGGEDHAIGQAHDSLGLSGDASISTIAETLGAADTGRSADSGAQTNLGGSGPGGEGLVAGGSVESGFTDVDVLVPDAFVPSAAEEALAEQVTYWVNQKTQNAEMILNRDGQPVEVSVTLSGNEAHVTFRSDQEHTRQMLDSSMAQLTEMLRGQGLVLSGASVSTSARDGRPSDGGRPQERGGRAGQSTVVAAEGVPQRAQPGSAARRAVDVFV